MAGAYIDLQAMQSLVGCMDGAAEDLRGIKGELVSILGGVDLDTSPPTPLETAAAWVSDQVPGLRRRLAMAQHIQGSNPKFGEGDPIPIDESKLSTLTPAQARQQAQAAALALQNLKPGETVPADVMAQVKANQDDPYYASAFAKSFDDPTQIAEVVKKLNVGYPGVDHRADMDPNDDQKAWIATYRDQLHTLAEVFGTATRTTSPDLKVPADWSQKWSDLITASPKSNSDGTTTYGDSLALSLMLKNGTYGTDFITKIADDAYHYERKEADGDDPVWAPKSDNSVWDPDMGDHHAPNLDVMANILKGLGHNPLAAQEFFDGDDSESMKIHGQDTIVDSKLKYFLTERGWQSPDKLSDDGDGLGDAIRAASTYYRDRGYFGQNSAEIASQTMALIGSHDGAGSRGGGFWNTVLHGGASSGWHMPSGLQDDVADILTNYMPDMFRAYESSSSPGDTVPPWVYTKNPPAQGVPGDPVGMMINREDLDKIMGTLSQNKDNITKLTTGALAYTQYQANHQLAQISDPALKAKIMSGYNYPPLYAAMRVGPSVIQNMLSKAYTGDKAEEEIKNANIEAMNKFVDIAGSFPVLDLAKVENPVAGWAFDAVSGELLDHLKGDPVDEADQLWSKSANSVTDKFQHNFQNLLAQNGFYDPKVIAILQQDVKQDGGITGPPPGVLKYGPDGKVTGINFTSDAYNDWAYGQYDQQSAPTNGTMPGAQLSEEIKQIYVTDFGVKL